jgi:thiopeptide-type bacteriocin biosynthesis protein
MSTSATLRLEAEPYYLLRRPLLPVQTVWQLHAATSQQPADLLPALLALFADPLLQEAIYTASPALYAELLKALATGGSDSPKNAEKLALTLYKYLLRMSTRCTPYGLFAGCARGQLAGQTAIAFTEQPLRKQSRLDMNYVSELVQHLLATPGLREQLRYYANNSLYRSGDTYRYVEFRVKNKRRAYTLTAVAHAPYLEALLEAAQAGCTFAELLALVQRAEPTASAQEAADYVGQLIDSQLLVSELEPTITGPVYLDGLPVRLAPKLPAPVLAPVQQLVDLLATGGVASFQETHQLLEETYGQSSSKDLIQTDLFFNTTHNQVSAGVADTIAVQLSELYRLAGRQRPADLASFSKDFSERFEEQEVPLLLALDSESGVGYGSGGPGSGDPLPVLNGIRPRPDAAAGSSWKKTVQLAHDVYHRTLRDETRVVELTAADLAGLDDQPDAVAATPASLYALGTLLAESAERLDAGDFRFALAACAGPSAANLLGRFCYGDDQLLEDVRATLRRTEPDTDAVVYAEVVHLPEARVGNILMRPALRAYEIPFLSPATVPADHQIPVQDLLVSVRNGRVVLRSRRLNKQVVPRLSTAHNYAAGLPIYRFLCDLQKDDLYAGIGWNWATLSEQAFLPRVQYKNIIVAKAQWLLRRERLVANPAQPADTSPDARLRWYLASHALPRYVCLTEHDNELLIDTEYPAARQVLLHKLEKTSTLRLTEFLGTPDQCFVGDAAQRYTNELLLPLRNPGSRPPVAPAPVGAGVPTRQFAPGSEWAYFKLYGGTKSLDKLLPDVLLPLAEQWQQRGLIRQWFFIRYTDPRFHLRLRFQLAGNEAVALATLLTELSAALAPALAQGRLHKLQLDTYVRELERYGADNIVQSEALFGYDSVATARVLSLLDGDEGEAYRWPLALRGLDEMLTDFGLALPQKQQLLDRLSRAFFQEFKGDKALQVQLNEKYRQESRRIQQFLNPAEDEATGIEEATAEFVARRRAWAPVIADILSRHSAGLLATEAGYSLLASYVHMYVNRFVLSRPRLHELTLYTLLHKYYTAQVAMRKPRVTTPAKDSALSHAH